MCWNVGLVQLVGPVGLFTGSPIPSEKLGHVDLAEAETAWLLKWRALREAGLTEQRELPAPCSGRITGWCSTSPLLPDGHS